jgi:inosine-uridine nucleoside N-ribohydrolase
MDSVVSCNNTGSSAKIPVILDTDIGDWIDDHYALVSLLQSPELDLKLVVSAYGDTVTRAKIIAKALETAQRFDVQVGIGVRSGSDLVRDQLK